jgi:hypothetical protein
MLSKYKYILGVQISFCIKLIFVLFLVASLAVGSIHPAQAAMEYVRISKIDITSFPNVTIRSVARDGNFNPIPVADLTSIEVLEEGNVVKTNLPVEVKQGVDVTFVVDLGIGSDAPGASGAARYIEMRDVISKYLGMMTSEDQAAIIVISGGDITIPQPLTSDLAKLRQSLTDVIKGVENRRDFAPTTASRGVNTALDELSNSPKFNESVQAVVLLSSGQQEGGSDRNSLITRANSTGTKIHTVITNYKDNDPIRLQTVKAIQELSDGTNGLSQYYSGPASIDALLSWLTAQRSAFEVSYRSTSGSSQPRTVQLRIKGGTSASSKFQVTVTPPIVVIDQPENNMEITRKQPSAGVSMDSADPKDMQVQVHLEWPNDKQSRKVTEAQLYVNDQKTGAPQTFPGNQLSFIFPLTSLRENGTTSLSFQVQITDELGVIGKSEPIVAKVHVELATDIATPTTIYITPQAECDKVSGFQKTVCEFTPKINNIAGILALGVALLTLILVIFFRRQIGQGVSSAYNGVRETIVRLTRPASAEVGAYLHVLKGDPTVVGKSIPVSLGTPTPIGRERGKCEILLDEGVENSVVSRVHCIVSEHAGQFLIRDMGSTYGTFLNGRRLEDGVENTLQNLDEIEIGPSMKGGYLMQLQIASGSESSARLGNFGTETTPYPLTNDEPDTTTRPHPFKQ